MARPLSVLALLFGVIILAFSSVPAVGNAGSGQVAEGAVSSASVDMAYISGRMESIAGGAAGTFGVYLKVPETGEEAGYQADRPFVAASCYKMFLVMNLYESAAAGGVDLERSIVYQAGDYTDGTGIIQFMPKGISFTTRKLCEYAIVYSDNVAANMLRRVYGYAPYRAYAASIGCPVSSTLGANLTTAREMCTVMARTKRFAEANPLGQEVLSFLRKSIYKSRIPAGLPEGVDVGNKTGDYEGYMNDAAIIMGDVEYVLCVLSSGAAGDGVHASISRMVYEELSRSYCGGGHCTTGVSQPSTQWYFAEGTTRSGFETWLCLANPGDVATQAVVRAMTHGGEVKETRLLVPASCRRSLLINELVGPDQDVALQVTSDLPLVAERPMYFRYRGVWSGGHCTTGVSQPSTQWYFAEGTTRSGFETWLCLANPGDAGATASVDYYLSDGEVVRRAYPIAPHSRYTICVNDELGGDRDVSAHIYSREPILAERPLYFGRSKGLQGGDCVVCAESVSNNWYFAEGCTRSGFEEWLCIGNPNRQVAKVTVSYLNEKQSRLKQTYNLAPETRFTVRVNDIVGEGHDVSLVVESDCGVVAERPMYFVFSPCTF